MVRKEWVGAGWMLLVTTAAVLAVDAGQKKEDPAGATAKASVPVVNYVVASPRAFLMGVPIEGAKEWAMIGAAENFPRANGTLEIPVGTRVIFSLGQEAEGVWLEGARGTVEMTLTIQWCQAKADAECDRCAASGLADGPAPTPDGKTQNQTKAGNPVPCPWITIATDGARDTRSGPSLGHTKVGVPIEFTQPGIYCVRGIVSTSVKEAPNAMNPVGGPKASSPRPSEPSTPKDAATESVDAPLAIDTDVVLAKIHVVDRLGPGAQLQEPATADPDVVYAVPMPGMADAKALRPDGDDAKDSGAIKLSPGVFIDTLSQDFVIPF
jgi:hypothetical protein